MFVRVADDISLTQPTQQIAASKSSGRWPAPSGGHFRLLMAAHKEGNPRQDAGPVHLPCPTQSPVPSHELFPSHVP